jgi:hypothetical protein
MAKCQGATGDLLRLIIVYWGSNPRYGIVARIGMSFLMKVVDLTVDLQVNIMANPLVDLPMDLLADPLKDLKVNILENLLSTLQRTLWRNPEWTP